jgi:hypothetical protein
MSTSIQVGVFEGLAPSDGTESGGAYVWTGGECGRVEVRRGEVRKRTDVPLQPPIIAGYQFKCLKAACMSGDACIAVLFDDTMPKVSVIGDIDLTTEHE